jgi:hypothetical protein
MPVSARMTDSITRSALDYLERTYNVPPGDVQRITVEGAHNDITRLTVTLLVHPEAISRTREVRVPLLRTPMLDETQRIDLGRPTGRVDGPSGHGSADLAAAREAAGSHAPQACAACGGLILWRVDEDPGRWTHAEAPDSSHVPAPAQ